MEKITIIGSGVTGLTVGVVLLEAGYDVTIFFKDKYFETTSNVAGAIWFPYEINPQERVNKWALRSYEKFAELAQTENSGVSITSLYKIMGPESPGWWINGLPASVVVSKISKFYRNHDVYIVNVPLIETSTYLAYLLSYIQKLGGEIYQRTITHNDLLNLCNDGMVINCAGLGSLTFLEDVELYPVKGQLLYLKPDLKLKCIVDDIEVQNLAYIFSRKDAVILGGTAEKGNYSMEASVTITQNILERCLLLQPVLKECDLAIIDVKVGLRPGRSSIRLEKDETLNIIHNYGHGGGGYTVSWGCAEEVLKMLKEHAES